MLPPDDIKSNNIILSYSNYSQLYQWGFEFSGFKDIITQSQSIIQIPNKYIYILIYQTSYQYHFQ